MGGGKCSDKLKMLMSNRRKNAQNCWIFGAAGRSDETARRSDEARHLLLPFPVLRSLRSLQTLRTIRSIRVLNSIREIRVQKQNVWFVFRFVYSFANAHCVGFETLQCRVCV